MLLYTLTCIKVYVQIFMNYVYTKHLCLMWCCAARKRRNSHISFIYTQNIYVGMYNTHGLARAKRVFESSLHISIVCCISLYSQFYITLYVPPPNIKVPHTHTHIHLCVSLPTYPTLYARSHNGSALIKNS